MLRQNRIAQLAVIFFLGLSIAAVKTSGNASGNSASQQPRSLELNKAIEGELRKGETQSFQLALKPLDYARVAVTVRNADLSLKLFAPDGKPVADYLWPQDAPDPAALSLIAGYTGDYRLEIASQEKDDSAKSYLIKLTTLRPIEKFDAERVEAVLVVAHRQQQRDAAEVAHVARGTELHVFDQRRLVDQCAPCGIDHIGGGFHHGQRLLIDQVPGRRVERAMERDEITSLEDLVVGREVNPVHVGS